MFYRPDRTVTAARGITLVNSYEIDEVSDKAKNSARDRIIKQTKLDILEYDEDLDYLPAGINIPDTDFKIAFPDIPKIVSNSGIPSTYYCFISNADESLSEVVLFENETQYLSFRLFVESGFYLDKQMLVARNIVETNNTHAYDMFTKCFELDGIRNIFDIRQTTGLSDIGYALYGDYKYREIAIIRTYIFPQLYSMNPRERRIRNLLAVETLSYMGHVLLRQPKFKGSFYVNESLDFCIIDMNKSNVSTIIDFPKNAGYIMLMQASDGKTAMVEISNGMYTLLELVFNSNNMNDPKLRLDWTFSNYLESFKKGRFFQIIRGLKSKTDYLLYRLGIEFQDIPEDLHKIVNNPEL
ncbi:MAG: hypothetical protein Q9M91_01045 [Candidatus Dojkabacteria bacterium]|nr:hypothetical protein [Candidatus Dojkabacteria bacterium]MDQ7020413.1 hypothetical protein [Candidatus Dojkabacteria bacterium]